MMKYLIMLLRVAPSFSFYAFQYRKEPILSSREVIFGSPAFDYYPISDYFEVLHDRESERPIFRGAVLRSLQDVASSLWRTAEPHSRWPSLQRAKKKTKTHASHFCFCWLPWQSAEEQTAEGGSCLAQVHALKVKHFHLCNKIAEAAPHDRAGQSKTLRSTKWWMAVLLTLQHDWLCLLGHGGAVCVKWSPLCGAFGPASALM